MITKFILLVGYVSMTTGEITIDRTVQPHHDSMGHCIAVGEAYYPVDQPGQFFMCKEVEVEGRR